MASTSGKFGFETLGPFYAANRLLGLLPVRENDNKVYRLNTGYSGAAGDGETFSADRRFLAHNALMLLLLYAAFRRCVALAGSWPCGDGAGCSSSAVEWTATAAGVAQAAACVAVAAAHRRTRTAGLLNCMRDVLVRGGGGGKARTADGRRRPPPSSHLHAAGAYAATATAIAAARSVAVAAAAPDRAADALLLCLPAAAVPVAVECAIVCACSAAEDACRRDVVDRLRRLARAPFPASRVRPAVRWQQVDAVWRDYWRCCRLVDRLSACYGLDLAVNLTVNTLFFVAYAYVTLASVYARLAADPGAAAFYWIAAMACQLACVSFRIVFVSYRAEKLKQAINSFTYQIVNREIKISACGFFSVNLSFFHGLVRLATTYLIVIIQYSSGPLRKKINPTVT